MDVSKKIPLDKDEALVVFDLKDGRRKEPLRDQQVANAAIGQLTINRQILAQQLAAAVDPRVIEEMALSQSNSTGVNGGAAGVGGLPFFGVGAVGYQPVIETLPEGAMLMAQAVISADRRYVRITPMPMFIGVGQVNTFNMATGASGSSSGGTGFSGYSGATSGGSRNLFRRPLPRHQRCAGNRLPLSGSAGGRCGCLAPARIAGREGRFPPGRHHLPLRRPAGCEGEPDRRVARADHSPET